MAHQRKNLPEHAEIERLAGDVSQLRDLLIAAQTQDSDLAREQTKAEQDVEQVRKRAARDQQRLDSGAVGSPRDLANLQHEIASLAKRQSDLEDTVLEVMERRETAQERVAELTRRLESVEAKHAEAEARRAVRFEEIDSAAGAARKERAALSETIPDDLISLYEKLRTQFGGVAAARLYKRRCEGCRLELGVTELNEVRAAAPDRVVRCENCRRILVRTTDSGI